MSGIDLVALAAMLGHARIQRVLRYARAIQELSTKAMDHLERFKAEQQIAALKRQSARTQRERKRGQNAKDPHKSPHGGRMDIIFDGL